MCVRHGCVGKRHPRHSNGYLRNFAFRNKRRKKGSPSCVLVYFRNELNKAVSVFDKSNEIYSRSKLGKIS